MLQPYIENSIENSYLLFSILLILQASRQISVATGRPKL